MKVLDLFSGIGGFSLGLERAGMETKAFCEIDKKTQLRLKKNWPGIPIYDDIRKLTAEKLKADGILAYANQFGVKINRGDTTNEGQSGNGRNIEKASTRYDRRKPGTGKDETHGGKKTGAGTIDLICGGFPCQPFSVAGKQRGEEDDRHLWPEMFRLIQEIRPRWVIGENVAGLINMGLDQVLSDLESEGYSCQTFIIPACAVNAPHRRDRVWILAYSERIGWGRRNYENVQRKDRPLQTEGSCSGKKQRILADSTGIGIQGGGTNRKQEPQVHAGQAISGGDSSGDGRNHWEIEPDVGRVADGIPNRVDRLKQLGNAVVPQVVEVIGRAIMEIHNRSGRE